MLAPEEGDGGLVLQCFCRLGYGAAGNASL